MDIYVYILYIFNLIYSFSFIYNSFMYYFLLLILIYCSVFFLSALSPEQQKGILDVRKKVFSEDICLFIKFNSLCRNIYT